MLLLVFAQFSYKVHIIIVHITLGTRKVLKKIYKYEPTKPFVASVASRPPQPETHGLLNSSHKSRAYAPNLLSTST